MKFIPQRKRGMTLVELLVSMSVLTVVLGIAFEMMIESQRAMQHIARRQVAVQQAQQGMRTVLDLLAAAAPASNLTGLSDKASIQPVFTKNRVLVPAYWTSENQLPTRVTIAQSDKGWPVIQSLPPNIEEFPLIRDTSRGYRFELQFGFACAAAPGAAPDYKDEWPADSWPDLIRVILRATPEAADAKPIILETAVIPGYIAGKATQAAVAPPPQPAPAATSQTLAQPAVINQPMVITQPVTTAPMTQPITTSPSTTTQTTSPTAQLPAALLFIKEARS